MKKQYETPTADVIDFAAIEKIALLGSSRDSSDDIGGGNEGSVGSRGDY